MAFTVLSCSGRDETTQTSKTASLDGSRRLTFVVGPIFRSITLNEVKTFVETGVPQGDIDTLIRFGGLKADDLCGLMTKSVSLGLVPVDKILRSSIGEGVLKKVGTIIHPRGNPDNAVLAIRAAVIASLANDDSLNFVEVLENLPVDMMVDVMELLALKDEIGNTLAPN
jgi:hypothetical protein